MNEVWATVISGIGGALIGGLIGVVSAVMSHRIAIRQLQSQQYESDKNREHQIRMSVIAKRQQAVEDLWKLLFVMERRTKLNNQEVDTYVRSLMWLPSVLQDLSLKTLKKHQAGVSNDQNERLDAQELALLRRKLWNLATSVDTEQATQSWEADE